MTITRGTSAGASQWWVNMELLRMSPNTTYTVQCWLTSDPSGQGGARVAQFTTVTNAAGDAWASEGSSCVMNNSGYVNLRIGPNIIWSNTIHL